MRRLSLTNKKLRNIPRRLKALSRWADSFEGCFYSELPLEHGYENAKIPVIESLVEGKQTTPEILAHCAQQLIRAAGYLVAARPDDSPECWVVASIIIPDMFSSEVCVYTDRSRYLGSTQPFDYEQFRQIRIIGRSLASEWGWLSHQASTKLAFTSSVRTKRGTPMNQSTGTSERSAQLTKTQAVNAGSIRPLNPSRRRTPIRSPRR